MRSYEIRRCKVWNRQSMGVEYIDDNGVRWARLPSDRGRQREGQQQAKECMHNPGHMVSCVRVLGQPL